MVHRTLILGLIFFVAVTLDASGAFRKKITIDHSNVFNTSQERFPVFVSLQSPDLKSTAHGGHVSIRLS